jgi:hypothetical protein
MLCAREFNEFMQMSSLVGKGDPRGKWRDSEMR